MRVNFCKVNYIASKNKCTVCTIESSSVPQPELFPTGAHIDQGSEEESG